MEQCLRAKREESIEEMLRRLPYGATDAEKARAAASARTALAEIPLTAGDLEMRAAVATAVEPITKAIEQRWRKADRVSDGVRHVSAYLQKLYVADEIDFDAYYDATWRGELEKAAREELKIQLTGAEDETRENAERIVEEIVDADLDA